MLNMKYIKFMDAGFVIFSPQTTHAVMARKFPNDTPMSAGEVGYGCNCRDDNAVHLYGKSLSLGIASAEGDTEQFLRNAIGY